RRRHATGGIPSGGGRVAADACTSSGRPVLHAARPPREQRGGGAHEIGPNAPLPPTIYVPYTANPWENTFLVVRAAAEPRSIIPAVRRAVLEVDSDLPVAGPSFMMQFQLMNDVLGRRLEQRDIQARLLAAFAAGALLLVLVGLFGLLSQIVTQRTREIGVRIALGARRTEVVRRVIGQAALAGSVPPGERDADLPRLDGMEVHVLDARRWLAGQPRLIEVRDIRVLRAQQVQHARADPERPAGPAEVEVEE